MAWAPLYVWDNVASRWTPALAPGGGLAAAVVGRYNSPDVVIANGAQGELQLTSAGFVRMAEQFAPGAEDNTNGVYAHVPKPLAVSTYTATVDQNQGAVNARNLKASAGNLFSLALYNTNAAARFCFLVNSAAAPVAGSASIAMPILVPAGAQVFLGEADFGQTGFAFSTGIGLAFMTTVGGGVLAAAGETFWTARYK